MKFETLVEKYSDGTISFDELVVTSAGLNWGSRTVDDTDGSVDWNGENVLADVYNTVVRGVLTADERDILLDAIREAAN